MQSYETRAYLPPVWDIEKNNGRLRQGTSISGLFKQFRWPLQTEKSVQSKLCEVRGIASYPVHGGVDVGCTRLDVLAMYGGVVTFAGTQSGYGLTVIIDHVNNVESLYGHLDSINVQVGNINKGEKVGVSGAWMGHGICILKFVIKLPRIGSTRFTIFLTLAHPTLKLTANGY